MFKLLGRVLLFINFVLLYVSLLLAISFKFQLLDSNFWIKSLQKADVYTNLEKTFKLVKGDIIQDFTEKNIVNADKFLNGKEEIKIYLPLKKLPRSFSVSDLTKAFGGQIPIQNYMYLSKTGLMATITLVISFVLFVLALWRMYKSVVPGAKLIFPGLSLVFSAILVFVLLFLGSKYSESVVASLEGGEPVQILLQNIIASIVPGVINFLVYVNLAFLVIGVGLLFVKKPSKVAS